MPLVMPSLLHAFATHILWRTPSLQHEGSPLLVCGYCLHGDKDCLDPEESHLHSDVLRLAPPIQKNLLSAAYLVSSGITYSVPCVVLKGPGRAARFLTTYYCIWCAHRGKFRSLVFMTICLKTRFYLVTPK